ncbi:hypothetical protein LEP1GSC170_4631 [Leptospira interrogans serovar Bataviae str. HAI135]|nr:hypothetical protein LEP1GSC170_4631 [Leptospira interrogans serovar Bataviae str. HAI135]
MFISYQMLTSTNKEVANSGIFISSVLVFVAVHEFSIII